MCLQLRSPRSRSLHATRGSSPPDGCGGLRQFLVGSQTASLTTLLLLLLLMLLLYCISLQPNIYSWSEPPHEVDIIYRKNRRRWARAYVIPDT